MLVFSSRRLLKILSLDFASAMALYPFIIVSHPYLKNHETLIRHEKIHLRQQLELGIIGFYIWYALEFLIRWFRYRNRRLAYENISFEREAYARESDATYLSRRPFWAFLAHL
ncbi:MAG: hypothetical protein GXO24_06745 [Chlorobi bacterium]|jgi:hypothetical protein|nr:hypothetical protein [Chlorobiota bacterium]